MTPDSFRAEARRIADRLRIDASTVAESGEVIWTRPPLGEDPGGGKLNPQLYDGSLGVAVLYAALFALDGKAEDRATVWGTIARLRQQLKQITADPERFAHVAFDLGALVGLGGYIYGFTLLSRLLDDDRLLDEAIAVSRLIDAERLAADRKLDVSHGAAGALLALDVLADAVPSAAGELVERCRACAEHLLARRTTVDDAPGAAWPFVHGDAPLCGIAHGAAGIAYALLRLYRRTGDAELQQAALDAFAYEDAHYDAEHANWLDLRNPARDSFWIGWCNGAPGIALARAKCLHLLDEDRRGPALEDLERAAAITRSLDLESVDYPCCGGFGRADVAIDLAAAEGRPEWLDTGRSIAEATIERARRDGGYRWSLAGAHPTMAPALLVGAAGGAYTLLRLADPTSLPSILAVELEPVAVVGSGEHASAADEFPVIVRLSGVPATAVDAFGSPTIGERVETVRRLGGELETARSELVDRLFTRIPELDATQRTRALAIKRDAFNGRPLARHRRRDDWSAILGGTEAAAERVVALEAQIEAIEAETEALYRQQLLTERQQILRWIEDPQLLRGMTMASPRIASHLGRLRRKPPERWGRKERSVERTVLRYLSRAALQISPFSTLTRVGVATAETTPDGRPATLCDVTWRERSLVQTRRAVLDRFTAVLLRVPVVRDALALTLNETLDVTESGKFRYIRPGRWTFDSETREMTMVGPASVQVALSGALVDWLVENTRGTERPLRDVIRLAQDAFGPDVAESTLRATVEKLIDIGFLRLLEPWGSDVLRLEPRILAHLDALHANEANGAAIEPLVDSFRRLLELEREVVDGDDPAASLRRCEETLQQIWQELTSLADLDPEIQWRPKVKTSICEDVLIENEVAGDDRSAFPERVAILDRAHLQKVAADVAPMIRLSNLLNRQHDLLSTLGAFAAERWPGRREIDFFTFFDAAQPLWREHTNFEGTLRREEREDEPEAFNPLGLESLERIRQAREDVWSKLSSCKVVENDRISFDGERLDALLDRVPEPWAPLRDATFFIQPADSKAGTWVLNTLFEELRYGCRYTALMSPDLCDRFTGYFEQRSVRLQDGEPVELIDVLCPGSRGVNVHALQTPRVLVVPGERTDAEPSRQLTLDRLKVELPPDGWPRLRDLDGRRLAPIYLGTTVLRFMPLMLKFLALFGPGTLQQVIPELAPEPLTDDVRLQDRLWSGQVLVKRRRWLVSVAALREKLFSGDDVELFVRAQHWRLDHGIPSRVFLARRSGMDYDEDHYKPQYVDFASPLSLALFRATIEPMERDWIGLEEMIPTPEAGLARPRDGAARWAFEIQLDSFPLRHGHGSSSLG
ncbi:MAG: lanthionine synthetase LanC family protein [Acidobacteriota bacterium]